MAWNYSNTFMETTLTGSVTPSATTISVASTSGLPVSFPFTLIVDFEQVNVEVVTVTGLAGSNLTVVRGQDGTAAQSHSLGARVVHGVVARDVREPQEHIEATQNVHGVGGLNDVVGTGTTQTLTNKTIDGATSIGSNGTVTVTRATADLGVINGKVTGDTVSRFNVQADGAVTWGPGGVGARDTNLYRSAADTLKTDDNLEVGGDVQLPATSSQVIVGGSSSSASVAIARAAATDLAYAARLTTDATNNRFQMQTDGKQSWGDGATIDTNLYRSAANVLKTDDNLEVAGDLTVAGVGQEIFAYKTTGETITNSTAYQDDNHLFANVVANGVYFTECFLTVHSDDAVDFQCRFTYPTDATLDIGGFGPGTTIGVSRTGDGYFFAEGGATPTTDIVYGTVSTSTPVPILFKGTLIVGGTAGTIRLQWAQDVASALPTEVRRGSYLRLTRVA